MPDTASSQQDGDNISTDNTPPATKSLSERALQLLLTNRIQEHIPSPNGGNGSPTGYTFPKPCTPATTIQDSTTTLLTSKAYAKAGLSDYGWEAMESLFAIQGTNGFVPRYRYTPPPPPSTTVVDGGVGGGGVDGLSGGSEDGTTAAIVPYYTEGGQYPNWIMFDDMVPEEFLPKEGSLGRDLGIRGSGRISSIPYHGTLLLEFFYQTSQTSSDVSQLQKNFDILYQYHYYIHEIVMRGCPRGSSSDDSRTVKDGSVGCYNVIHPWESDVEKNSVLWSMAMSNVVARMKELNWKPKFEVPKEVTESFDYPGDEMYNGQLFLVDCIAETVRLCQNKVDKDNNVKDEEPISGDNNNMCNLSYEDRILSHCGFAILDVNYAAALSQSDSDLLKIADILKAKNSKTDHLTSQVTQLSLWENQSKQVMKMLWDEEYRTYLSKVAAFEQKRNEKNNETFFVFKDMKSLVVPVGYNFLASWDNKIPGHTVDSLTFQLLSSDGKFAFDCGSYPLWSTGGCHQKGIDRKGDDILKWWNDRGYEGDETDLWPERTLGVAATTDRLQYDSLPQIAAATTSNSNNASIYPQLNYLVSRGMIRNHALAIGHFLLNSTLNLLCNLPNIDRTNFTSECNAHIMNNFTFALAYDTITSLPHNPNDECSITTTSTAAILYDILTNDKPSTYIPAPPIRSSWVIVLIAAELAMAFTIGVSCLVLSLNLFRRLKDNDDGDAFVRMVREGSHFADPSDWYARDSEYMSCNESIEGGSLLGTDEAGGGEGGNVGAAHARRRLKELDDFFPQSKYDWVWKFGRVLNPLNYLPKEEGRQQQTQTQQQQRRNDDGGGGGGVEGGGDDTDARYPPSRPAPPPPDQL